MLGAFGAHAAADVLTTESLATWQTAVHYHLIHVLALLLTGVVAERNASRSITIAGIAFGLGVFLFSGSLYLLAFDGPGWLGPVTPLGGAAFVMGWLALALGVTKPVSP